MSTFKDMGLPSMLEQALDGMGFTLPTPIQAQAIPLALKGSDILGSAKTGTGKTLAFSLPLLNQLLKNVESSAVILSPTRELAQQIHTSIRNLMGGRFGIKTALLIGGEPYGKQFSQLRMNPRIVVGTPGRVIDHLDRRTLTISSSDFLVLDETDRMFDMGLGEQVTDIIAHMPTVRQTLMFSATFTPKVESLAQKHLKNPHRIFVDSGHAMAVNLTEEIMQVKDSDKDATLLQVLDDREGSILIFVGRKVVADRVARYLCAQNHNAVAIHGDLRQQKRERAMESFRKGRYRIMVATDVAARGIDIPHIRHVINYDLPHSPEDYIHRVGRTARAGAEGCALNFISAGDQKRWYAIQRLMNPGMAHQRPERDRSEAPARRGKPWDKKKSFAPKQGPDKKWGGFKKGGEDQRPQGDRPRSYTPRDDRPQGDRPRSYTPREDRPQGDRPRRYAPGDVAKRPGKSGGHFGGKKPGAAPFAAKKRPWEAKKSPRFKKAS